jgi:hypothetical protein
MGRMATRTGDGAALPPRPSPADRIDALAQAALGIARKANRQRKSLSGANFYADKLAELRSDVTAAFREAARSPGDDVEGLAALVDACFSPTTGTKERLEASRTLRHRLRTEWSTAPPEATPGEENAIFPLSLLSRRGYLASIGRQMNGCYERGWYDACGVMMRRLLEIAIVEAFERKGIDGKAKDSNGDFLQLTALIDVALGENGKSWNLGRATKAALPKLRDIGHRSAHGRLFTHKSDIEKVQRGCRDAVEDFLRIAELL